MRQRPQNRKGSPQRLAEKGRTLYNVLEGETKMPSAQLENVKQQIELLADDERSFLLLYLMQIQEQADSTSARWSDIAGAATYPLVGEDAQDWISRSRQESERDPHR